MVYFGLVFSSISSTDEFVEALRLNGFFAYRKSSDEVHIHLNPRLTELVGAVDSSLRCTPLVGEGELRGLCLEQKDTKKQLGMEGMVLSGSGILHKWKTGKEDESRGGQMLGAIVSIPPNVLRLVGIDVEVANCLHDVLANQSTTPAKIERALQSALSKYDSLDTYH